MDDRTNIKTGAEIAAAKAASVTPSGTEANCADLSQAADIFPSGSAANPREGMTIAKAKELFAQYRTSLEPDYASIMRVLREMSNTSPIANSNYLHGLGLTDLMFRQTHRSLRMLTGSASEALPVALYESFRQMLSRIKENRGTAKVIVINGSTRNLERFQDDYAGTLTVATGIAQQGARITHFMVCDTDMVRDEEYHPDLTDDSSADLVKASMYFSNKAKADSLVLVFNRIWSIVTSSAK